MAPHAAWPPTVSDAFSGANLRDRERASATARVTAVLAAVRAMTQEEADALDRAPAAAPSATPLEDSQAAVRERLRRLGVDVHALERIASQAITLPQWGAHPGMTAGEFLDCSPAISREWVHAEHRAIDAVIAAAAAEAAPDAAARLASPWVSVYGPDVRAAAEGSVSVISRVGPRSLPQRCSGRSDAEGSEG